MKKRTKKAYLKVVNSHKYRYPNAADANYFNRKALDVFTAIVSGMGMITAMAALVTLA